MDTVEKEGGYVNALLRATLPLQKAAKPICRIDNKSDQCTIGINENETIQNLEILKKIEVKLESLEAYFNPSVDQLLALVEINSRKEPNAIS